MKTKNTDSSQKLSRKFTIAPHRKQYPFEGSASSESTEAVGNKSFEQLEADWLKHYRNTEPQERPDPSWFTCREMAEMAKVHRRRVQRYLDENESHYEKIPGRLLVGNRMTATAFYRFKS